MDCEYPLMHERTLGDLLRQGVFMGRELLKVRYEIKKVYDIMRIPNFIDELWIYFLIQSGGSKDA